VYRNGQKVHILPLSEGRWENIPERRTKNKDVKPFVFPKASKPLCASSVVRGPGCRMQVFNDRPSGNGEWTMRSARPTR
jgi:hypothetical protein